LVKFTGSTSGGNSLVYDTGTNVGIGTASPSNNLSIGAAAGKIGFQRGSGDGEYALIGYKGTTGNDRYVFEINNTSGTGELRLNQGGTSTPIGMTFYTNNAEKMRIDSSGNVGIGTNVPNKSLVIAANSSTPQINIYKSPDGSLNAAQQVVSLGTGSSQSNAGTTGGNEYGILQLLHNGTIRCQFYVNAGGAPTQLSVTLK